MRVHVSPPSDFYKSVALTILELLAFNEQKIRGSRDNGHAPIGKFFKGLYPDCPWEHVCQIWNPYLQPLWSDWRLTPRNLGGHMTLATPPPFGKSLRGHVRTVPGNILVKFEVRNFNLWSYLHLTLVLNCRSETDTHRTNTLFPPFTSFTWRRHLAEMQRSFETYVISASVSRRAKRTWISLRRPLAKTSTDVACPARWTGQCQRQQRQRVRRATGCSQQHGTGCRRTASVLCLRRLRCVGQWYWSSCRCATSCHSIHRRRRSLNSLALHLGGGFYVGAGEGHVPPDSLVAPPPQIQKLADRSDVSSEVHKCSKIQIFGDPPGPPRELTALPGELQRSRSGGARYPLPRTPPRNRGPRFYGSQGLTPYRVGSPALLMIDFKCRPIWSSYFFGFGERRQWTRWWRSWWGQCPRILGLEPPLHYAHCDTCYRSVVCFSVRLYACMCVVCHTRAPC